MSKQTVSAAFEKVKSDLGSNEKIVWSGTPDPQILSKKAKNFFWKNFFFIAAVATAAAVIYVRQPVNARLMLTLLGAVAIVRLIGCMFVWSDRAKRKRSAYVLTSKRLMSVDGKTLETTSWYSPLIDRMHVRKFGEAATFRLKDTELGFEMVLHYAPEPWRLKSLLQEYVVAEKPKPTLKAIVSNTTAEKPAGSDWLEAA